MQVGIQVSSFRPVLKTEEQVFAAFKRMSQMNCKIVQLQWIDYSIPVDYLMEHVPELELCLDLYHCNRMKRIIPAMLERYHGRVPMVHYMEGKFLPDGKEILVPVGSGEIDWSGVAEACDAHGVRYAMAEQEAWQGDPFEELEAGFTWLSAEARRASGN